MCSKMSYEVKCRAFYPLSCTSAKFFPLKRIQMHQKRCWASACCLQGIIQSNESSFVSLLTETHVHTRPHESFSEAWHPSVFRIQKCSIDCAQHIDFYHMGDLFCEEELLLQHFKPLFFLFLFFSQLIQWKNASVPARNPFDRSLVQRNCNEHETGLAVSQSPHRQCGAVSFNKLKICKKRFYFLHFFWSFTSV